MNNIDGKRKLKWIGLICLLLFVVGCLKKSPDSTSNTTPNQEIAPPENNQAYVECSGTLQPGKRFVLKLGAGERVSKILVNKEEIVDKDQPLVLLANDDMQQQITALEEMKLKTWREKEDLKLLDIEINNEKNNKQELENLIAKERQIGEEIPGYQVDRQIRQWQEEFNRSEGKLRILKERLAIQKQSYAKQKDLVASRETMLADLKLRASKLKILAPFRGTVKRLHPSAEKAIPGELILELWDESFYLIHADLWQNQVVNVNPGNRVEVYPDFYKNTCLTGIVQSMPAADIDADKDQFPKFPVYVELKKQDRHLVIGMAVSLRIFTGDSAEREASN
jgi:hypothetical protein